MAKTTSEHLLTFKPRKEVKEPATVEVKLVIVSSVVLRQRNANVQSK